MSAFQMAPIRIDGRIPLGFGPARWSMAVSSQARSGPVGQRKWAGTHSEPEWSRELAACDGSTVRWGAGGAGVMRPDVLHQPAPCFGFFGAGGLFDHDGEVGDLGLVLIARVGVR